MIYQKLFQYITVWLVLQAALGIMLIQALYVLRKNGHIIAVASAGEFKELADLCWTPPKALRIGKDRRCLHNAKTRNRNYPP